MELGVYATETLELSANEAFMRIAPEPAFLAFDGADNWVACLLGVRTHVHRRR
jgi:hypothetical protein